MSTKKCSAAHSAAGGWREQRVRDAVEHLLAEYLRVPDLHFVLNEAKDAYVRSTEISDCGDGHDAMYEQLGKWHR